MATKAIASNATKKVTKVEKKDSTPTFKVSLEELLESGAHFGHLIKRWNPKMKEFIWTERDGVHIFDLAKTAKQIEAACKFLYQQAAEGKVIVIVGTKRQAKDVVREVAAAADLPFITERWLGGTLTNWQQVYTRIKKLNDWKDKREKGGFAKYTKRERLLIDREILRLERFFGGLSKLTREPDVLFVIDTHKERTAVREAKAKGLAVVGITDTNADPRLIDLPIPANDDALRSIKLIVELVGKAIAEGKKRNKI